MNRQPLLVVIGGPTASGKTSLAIALAQHFGTEIVGADSRQFYREMRIGNARPEAEELAAAPHHLIADRSLLEPLTAGTFAEAALPILDRIFQSAPLAIAVGGSGLYLRSLCEGLDEFPPVSEAAAARVQALGKARGLEGLQAELLRLDPDYYQSVDLQNGRRIERALRVCYSSDRAYSSFLGQAPGRPFRCLYLQPATDRDSLYNRINRRVDEMLDRGLQAEVESLHPHRHLPVLQTVGYQEWWPYLAGAYDRDRAVELTKRNSRRYAKRQITWFRDYLPVADAEAAISLIRERLG